MFSQEFKQHSNQVFCRALRNIPSALANEVSDLVNDLSGDLKHALEFLYGTLPFRVITTVPFDVLKREAEHALSLRGEDHWKQDLPEDLFVHFVLTPLVNDENVEECRRFFHSLVFERVNDLPLPQAILETNLWACEQVSYQASSDRTESPLTAYRSGKGRCGEESAFVVTVLRSLGIAARQIYAPFWSHCDDNHAWVEVYVDGKWHFLGACEPEPVLDRGWFVAASSRAMLIHARTLSDFTCEGMKDEELIECRDGVFFFNETLRYAPVCMQKFRVSTTDGKAAAGTAIRLQVLNMAAFSTVAILRTDKDGMAHLGCGFGTFHAEVSARDEYAVLDFQTGEREYIDIRLRSDRDVYQCDLNFYAPKAQPLHNEKPSEAQIRENRLKIRRAEEKRRSRIEAYYHDFCRKNPCLPPAWKKYLETSKGNAHEIGGFLLGQPPQNAVWAERMLGTLEEKDLRDATSEVLSAHLDAALAFLPEYNGREDDFVLWQLSPRIGLEALRPWRQPLAKSLNKQERELFAKDPALAAKAILEDPEDRVLAWYAIVGLPKESRDPLFVALTRTVGRCARLNPASGKAEYLTDSGWNRAFTQGTGRASLRLEAVGSDYHYRANWSLNYWNGETFQVLKYPDLCIKAKENKELIVDPGTYRIITTNRLPNGNQLANMREITLHDGDELSCALSLREAKASDMLDNNPLQDFKLTRSDGGIFSAKKLCAEGHNTLFAFLQVGAEPTEHFLNELRERRNALEELELALIIRDMKEANDPTLKRLLDSCPDIPLYTNPCEDNLHTMARGMFLDPDSLPVVVLSNEAFIGIYGYCGYSVGGVDMALKLSRLVLGA